MYIRTLAVLLLTSTVSLATSASAQDTATIHALQIAELQAQVAALMVRLESLSSLETRPDRAGFWGRSDALFGLHQRNLWNCRSTEAALWTTGFDDSGREMKQFSLSALCADPHPDTYYSVVRMNAAYADRTGWGTTGRRVIRDEISQRWWGNQGSCLFCTSDLVAPGTRILQLKGALRLPTAEQLPDPVQDGQVSPLDPSCSNWEWLKVFDEYGYPFFLRACR